MFSKSSVNKNSLIFLVSLEYRDIVMVKWYHFIRNFFYINSLKSKKKKLALISCYYVSRGIWLGRAYNKWFSYMLFLFVLWFHDWKKDKCSPAIAKHEEC